MFWDQKPAKFEFLIGLAAISLLMCGALVPLPGGASVGQIALVLLLPFGMNAMLARQSTVFDKTSRFRMNLILVFAAILGIMSLMSAAYTETPMRIGRVFIPMVAAFSVYFFVAGTLTIARVQVICWTVSTLLAFIGFLCILAVFFQPVGDLVIWPKGFDRARGLFKNPNQYGIVTSTLVPMIFMLIISENGLKRALLVVFLLLSIGGLLLSGSKTNYLLTSASISLLTILTLTHRTPRELRPVVVVLATVVVFLFISILVFSLQFINPRAFDLLITFVYEGSENRTIASRESIWERSFDDFARNPFFGSGAGSSIEIFESGNRILYTHSHNSMIDYARTLGALGFVSMFAIHIVVIWTSIETLFTRIKKGCPEWSEKIAVGLALGCMNYIFANLMSDSFGPTTIVFFWLVVFLQFYLNSHSSKLRAYPFHQGSPDPDIATS